MWLWWLCRCGQGSCCGRIPFTATENLFFFFFLSRIFLFKPDDPQAPGLSYSPTFQLEWRLSRSWPIKAQHFCFLQASPGSPISLVMTQPASTVSVGEHCPCVSATSSFFPPSDFKHPGPSWCLSILPVWQGREPLTWLSSKTLVAGPGAGPGAAAALVPALVPGTLPSRSNLLTICFSMSSTTLASKLHMCWDSVVC